MRSGIGDDVRIAAPHGATVEIAVDGDVDLASLGGLRDVLDVAVHRRSGTVVVDLTGAGFVTRPAWWNGGTRTRPAGWAEASRSGRRRAGGTERLVLRDGPR